MNRILCSTGVFVGRPNNRNPFLISEYYEKLRCPGIELMLYDTWRERGDDIVSIIKNDKINVPVIHADKVTGDLINDPEADENELYDIFDFNCSIAKEVGASKLVFHPWGLPCSDKHLDVIQKRVTEFVSIARRYDVLPMAENCICTYGSPIEHLEKFAEEVPGLYYIIDTRAAQFHEQIERIFEGSLFKKGLVRHMHLIDYDGGYRDFDHRYPIPDPGMGKVNFDRVFTLLKQAGYNGTITMEASMHRTEGVDVERINAALDYLNRKAEILYGA